MARQVILDTETTGLDVDAGERVIEIGCIELIDGREGDQYHVYINPGRAMSDEALAVHGISVEFLGDKPVFHEIADDLVQFVRGAELVAHNASFDTGFLDREFEIAGRPERMAALCPVVHDTLALAREIYPGAAASLDALCNRFQIDRSGRAQHHGALLDAQLLMSVWLRMSSRQSSFDFSAESKSLHSDTGGGSSRVFAGEASVVYLANQEEERAHLAYLRDLGDNCVWKKLDEGPGQLKQEVHRQHADSPGRDGVGESQP